MGLKLEINYGFFLESINYLRKMDSLVLTLGEALHADIYGGPQDAYNHELAMWGRILPEEKYAMFCGFVTHMCCFDTPGNPIDHFDYDVNVGDPANPYDYVVKTITFPESCDNIPAQCDYIWGLLNEPS